MTIPDTIAFLNRVGAAMFGPKCKTCGDKRVVMSSRVDTGVEQVARGERADPFMITDREWMRGVTNSPTYFFEQTPCPDCQPKEKP